MSSFGLFLILFSRSVFSTRSLLISFATPHCASLRYACMGLLRFRAACGANCHSDSDVIFGTLAISVIEFWLKNWHNNDVSAHGSCRRHVILITLH